MMPSILEIGISRNANCANSVGLPKSGHVLKQIASSVILLSLVGVFWLVFHNYLQWLASTVGF